MLYPIYVHKDPESSFGVTFPDFPGCFSAADQWDQIPASAQEAIQAHFADGLAPPKATPLDKLMLNTDYSGGAWMMVDVDLNRLNTKTIRLNVSLPESLVYRIDGFAKTRHMSRSAFLAQAASQAMAAELA